MWFRTFFRVCLTQLVLVAGAAIFYGVNVADVTLHEGAHFGAGAILGVKAESIALGSGPVLARVTIGDLPVELRLDPRNGVTTFLRNSEFPEDFLLEGRAAEEGRSFKDPIAARWLAFFLSTSARNRNIRDVAAPVKTEQKKRVLKDIPLWKSGTIYLAGPAATLLVFGILLYKLLPSTVSNVCRRTIVCCSPIIFPALFLALACMSLLHVRKLRGWNGKLRDVPEPWRSAITKLKALGNWIWGPRSLRFGRLVRVLLIIAAFTMIQEAFANLLPSIQSDGFGVVTSFGLQWFPIAWRVRAVARILGLGSGFLTMLIMLTDISMFVCLLVFLAFMAKRYIARTRTALN